MRQDFLNAVKSGEIELPKEVKFNEVENLFVIENKYGAFALFTNTNRKLSNLFLDEDLNIKNVDIVRNNVVGHALNNIKYVEDFNKAVETFQNIVDNYKKPEEEEPEVKPNKKTSKNK